MALKLFEHPLSPYSRKVKIVLYEKGLPFDRLLVDPSRQGDDAVYQEFVMASPRLEVPCLVDGDVRIFDSTVILEYLDERWPSPPMLPEAPAERARLRMLEEMMDTQYEAINWGLMEVNLFRRAEGERAVQLLGRARDQIQRIWNRLELALEGRDWFAGARFGRADAAVYPHLSASAAYGYAPGEAHMGLKRWMARSATRASIVKDEAEMSDAFRVAAAGVAAGGASGIVRQYRDHRLEWMMRSGGVDIVLEGLEKGSIRFSTEFE